MKTNKTNAARILDKAGIPYELIPYRVDENNLAADHIANELGEDINQVYKTLTLKGDKTGIFVCVVAGNREVDLKKAAKASGNKNADLIPLKELLPTTGYIRGGCSPIGLKKPYPVFLDERIVEHERVYISAGQRGLQFLISPQDIAKAVSATFANVATDETI
ncbi:MAG: Cys-tRNA(Pro) deacylase [Marinilabiliaceae bacterium]|nr:Cys-tRNA(Pro) deacylase [Marinilabiliaceae bacterium]